MVYLSRGVARQDATEYRLWVVRGGEDFLLTGMEAALWLNGRFRPAFVHTPYEKRMLRRLVRMGTAVAEEQEGADSVREMLDRCEFCAARASGFRFPIFGAERQVFGWAVKKGACFTVSGLAGLMETGVVPSGRAGREDAEGKAVKTVLGLVRKKRLLAL